jgi:hypothetical protein
MMVRWHWVQYTPSTPYTNYSVRRVQHTPKYSIYRVQHPPNIVYLLFNLTIASEARNPASASGVPPYTIDRHQLALHDSPKVRSYSHIPMVAS